MLSKRIVDHVYDDIDEDFICGKKQFRGISVIPPRPVSPQNEYLSFFFPCRPELYLLGDTSSQIGTDMEDRARAELVEEYFSSTGVGAPQVEGFLWLKAEAKKATR